MPPTREPERLISLGLSAAAAPSQSPLPDAEALQFRKADMTEGAPAGVGQTCAVCQHAFIGSYFWVDGVKACSPCALAIQAAQRAPRPHLFLKAFLWGLGAAFVGTIVYSTVTIVTGIRFALISILIGYLVGKAIRHACQGRGGRTQQIMAVMLTYVSITASYLPIAIHHRMVNGPTKKIIQATEPTSAGRMKPDHEPETSSMQSAANAPTQARPRYGLLATLVLLLAVVMAAPFLALPSLGGFVSLLVIFWGLQRAWIMAGQAEVVVVGPLGDGI